MKRKTSLVACGALLAFTVILVAAIPSISAAFKNVAVGGKTPDFVLKDLDGKEHTKEDLFAGKVTVVLFWATWSPRSAEVLADLEILRQEVGEEALQVVAINAEHAEISSADRRAIKDAVAAAGSSASVLLDQGLATFNAFGTIALPSLLVVDASGTVTFSMAGYPTTMRSDVPKAVKLALGLVSEEEIEVVEAYVPKNHALMYFNMGKRLYNKGHEEKAIPKLLESVERDPDFKRPRVLLGLYYKKSGRHDEALAQFQKVKEIDPRDVDAGYQAASLTLVAGKYDEAMAMFEELHTEYPEREEFALGLALAKKYSGDEASYSSLREKASGLYPAGARHYYELGGVAESENDLKLASELYREALRKAFKTARR